MKTDLAVFSRRRCWILPSRQGEIGRDGRGKILGGADAQVAGHAFQAVGKIGIPQAESADKREDGNGQNGGRALGTLEFHALD